MVKTYVISHHLSADLMLWLIDVLWCGPFKRWCGACVSDGASEDSERRVKSG